MMYDLPYMHADHIDNADRSDHTDNAYDADHIDTADYKIKRIMKIKHTLHIRQIIHHADYADDMFWITNHNLNINLHIMQAMQDAPYIIQDD